MFINFFQFIYLHGKVIRQEAKGTQGRLCPSTEQPKTFLTAWQCACVWERVWHVNRNMFTQVSLLLVSLFTTLHCVACHRQGSMWWRVPVSMTVLCWVPVAMTILRRVPVSMRVLCWVPVSMKVRITFNMRCVSTSRGLQGKKEDLLSAIIGGNASVGFWRSQFLTPSCPQPYSHTLSLAVTEKEENSGDTEMWRYDIRGTLRELEWHHSG